MKEQPPVDAFWSLTMYNASDKMLVENPIRRYKVGTDTQGLKTGSDGSLKIAVQNTKPDDPNVNWLPAPKGDFYVILRMYQPSEKVLKGTWELPLMTRAK